MYIAVWSLAIAYINLDMVQPKSTESNQTSTYTIESSFIASTADTVVTNSIAPTVSATEALSIATESEEGACKYGC